VFSLLAGKSGVREIERFDASAFPTRFAAQIKDFDSEGYEQFLFFFARTLLCVSASSVRICDMLTIQALCLTAEGLRNSYDVG
jgi:3-oxoacyl-(acyl-carrier-protein) synthase